MIPYEVLERYKFGKDEDTLELRRLSCIASLESNGWRLGAISRYLEQQGFPPTGEAQVIMPVGKE